MIHLKNHKSGFMLMEVMITIAIVGIVIAPIFMMQSNSFRGLSRYSSKLRFLFPAKNFLVETIKKDQTILSQKDQDQQEKIEIEKKQITNPAATLTCKKAMVGKNSAFKEIKNIQKYEVTIASRKKNVESIIGFVYKPEREKK